MAFETAGELEAGGYLVSGDVDGLADLAIEVRAAALVAGDFKL